MNGLFIDPGFGRMGVCIGSLNEKNLIEYFLIETSSKLSFPKRLEQIYTILEKKIQEYNPNVIALESPIMNGRQGFLLAQSVGVINLLSAQYNIADIVTFTPTQVKKNLTNNAKASKKDIEAEVLKQFQLSSSNIEQDDVSDSIAVYFSYLSWKVKN